MKAKRFLFLALPMILVVSGLRAQMAINFGQQMLIKISDKTLYGDPAAEKIDGSPFLNDAIIDGVVVTKKGRYPGVPMRYNIYEDVIEFKQNDKLFLLDPQPFISRIELDGHVYVIENHEVKGKQKPGFFLLLDSGKVTLLLKKVVTFKEQQAPKPLEPGPTPAKFSKAPDVFYYKIGNGELMRVDNIKKMIATFPDKQAELTEFAKKEKTSAKREDELVKLTKYYNSL